MRSTYAVSIAALLLIPLATPAAAASPAAEFTGPVETYVSFAECSPGMANLGISQMLARDPVTPQSKACISLDGSCQITVTQESEMSGWASAFVYLRFSFKSSVRTTTTLHCSGTWSAQSVHYGGVGLREGRLDIRQPSNSLGVGGVSSSMHDLPSPVPMKAVARCTYVGQLGSCMTPPMTLGWERIQVVEGVIERDSITACLPYDLSNTLYPVDLLATLDSSSACVELPFPDVGYVGPR